MMSKFKITEPKYFSISLPKLALLSIFTLGVYDIYWFYHNWKAVKAVEGSKIRPFWRAFFRIFFVFQLFSKIVASAERHGYKKRWYTDRLAGAYFAMFLLGGALGRAPENWAVNVAFLTIVLIGVVPLLLVQKVADFSNSKASSVDTNKTSAWQIPIIIVGVLLFALAFMPVSETGLTSDQQAMKARMDALTSQYDTCSSELAPRQENLDTTDQVAVDTYNADWDKCEAIRLEQNEAVDAYNDSIGQVTK